MATEFRKMHGLGNDFVVVDNRGENAAVFTKDQIRRIADRKTGVGCDQFVVIEPAPDGDAAAFMRIYNADGGEVEACGNAARCVSRLLMDEGGLDAVLLDTASGVLSAGRAENGVTVDMGALRTNWDEIPLARDCDTLAVPLGIEGLPDPVAVNIGNPHAVFFIDDAEHFDPAGPGPRIETHEMFPERTNVEFATVTGEGEIRMRVWERGVGITQACGTGACATLAAAALRGLCAPEAAVHLDGGTLYIRWDREKNRVFMTGPASDVYKGVISDDFHVT